MCVVFVFVCLSVKRTMTCPMTSHTERCCVQLNMEATELSTHNFIFNVKCSGRHQTINDITESGFIDNFRLPRATFKYKHPRFSTRERQDTEFRQVTWKRVSSHWQKIKPVSDFASGPNQIWNDRFPCGLYCSHCSEKHLCLLSESSLEKNRGSC